MKNKKDIKTHWAIKTFPMPVRTHGFNPIISHFDGEIAAETLGREQDREIWRLKRLNDNDDDDDDDDDNISRCKTIDDEAAILEWLIAFIVLGLVKTKWNRK